MSFNLHSKLGGSARQIHTENVYFSQTKKSTILLIDFHIGSIINVGVVKNCFNIFFVKIMHLS